MLPKTKEKVKKILELDAKKEQSNFTPQEVEIIRIRFQLDLEEKNRLDMEQTKERFNITEKQIRALDSKVIKKIRYGTA